MELNPVLAQEVKILFALVVSFGIQMQPRL